ncbi:alpha/beta fold hydrolase [Aeromonas media]|uniref:alpha/beta fold hydrolase n=1 Tax=Aeromonas media TaxID=651 RepID=UPI003D076D40
MTRLSKSLADLKDHYTVVVVGSGYGGSIAASRFARAGQSVCLLERGREFLPGEFPRTLPDAVKETQVDLPDSTVSFTGSRMGLYDFRVNEDMNVFLGCGLGGTSLVNANVALEAEKRVFEDLRWPQELLADYDTLIEQGYQHAREMLRPTPYPDTYPKLPKLEAHAKSASEIGGNFYKPPITVTFQNGVNHVGLDQAACTNCGDCVSGCNEGSKNTLAMNYLPDARNFGAEIFTCVSVRRLERAGEKWLVHFQALESGREKFGAPTQFVSADIVVLAAGALGSTEILLRSRAGGLSLSDQLGRNFTGNGDVLAFGYNCDEEIRGVGHGHMEASGRKPVGPTITSIIDQRGQSALNDGMVVEEGALPGPLAPIYPKVLSAAAKLSGKDTDDWWDFVRERARDLESLVRGAYKGAVANTQTYLVMTHDDAAGRMTLENDRLRVSWPGVGKQPIFQKANERLEQATKALGGIFTPNPMWADLLGKKLVTVHPLGGCSMGASAQQGVVNHKGQVFSGMQGANVHDGLYVCDGAVMPRSLGVNPFLTIAALAERNVQLAARDRNWTIDYTLPSKPPPPAPPFKLGIQFTETMRGFFSTAVKTGDTKADYAAAHDQGRAAGSSLEFTLTVISDDLDALLDQPAHRARMIGTLTVPALAKDPLMVTEGQFNLFILDPNEVNVRRMEYRMKLTAESGQKYFFFGCKVVHSEKTGLDAWADTTTLYITVHEGADANAPVLGKGRLHIQPLDFARQMTTMQVTNAPNLRHRLEGMARFGKYFGGSLWQAYGGLGRRDTLFDPKAPPRQKRPLRAPVPEVHFCKTSDDVELRLTRYRGGNKGPVLLAHGLGVSSLIFTIDTINTNLVEYLVAHGYDVWCLDFRASIELPAAVKHQSTGDDVATKDYPAAVQKIRDVTGVATIQAVVHCWGSTTFFMAMLAGLQGVRSFVASQVALHVKAPVMTKLKTGLHVPSFLQQLKINSLNAYVDKERDWQNKLFDAALKLYPTEMEELCDNPVCQRIAFMYAPLYEHTQLNDATHRAMHEMFGIANMRSFEHVGRLVNTGHLVDVAGHDCYLPNISCLNLPICFIHGAENACFHPESTKLTYDLLCQQFRPENYTRYVIPRYGHIDCIFGKNAHLDVFPYILKHLDAT